MNAERTRRLGHWAWVLLLIGVLGVYLRTLTPGVVGGDPGELQFVPAILSIPHPTGTPLYILLGKLWSMLPLGPTVAWRMNLLAAVSAALACLVVYFTVYQADTIHSPDTSHPAAGRLLPALGAALSLAVGLTFWEQALLADKYAFNALMVSLILYLTLRWGRTRAPGTLRLLALVYGLSLAHHRTMALFAPFLLAYVWVLEKGALWRDGRRLLRLGALVLAPLLLYFYLPWGEARGLPPGTWHPGTAREWYDYLFDTGRTGLVYVDPDDLGEMLLFYARTLLRDFTWAGVALGVGGAVTMFRRRWLDAAFLLANYVVQAFLAANHHVPRHWVYFIPSFVMFALWVGEGLSALWWGLERIRPRVGRVLGVTGSALLALATLAWPLFPSAERYRPLRDAHQGVGVLDVWRQTLKRGYMGDRVGRAIAGVEAGAIVLCDWEQATPLWYYQQVEGLRPDVEIVYPVERLEEAAESGRPLYIARAKAGLADRWHPSCSDSLIRLQEAPAFDVPSTTAAPDIAALGARMGPFELAGYAVGDAPEAGRTPYAGRPLFYPGEVVPLTLHWRAVEKPEHDYSVSVRFFDPGGGQVGQVDAQHPVLGTYPTSRWATGEVVSDYYELQVPPRTAPGAYRWGAILYRALPEGGWESLQVEGSGEEMAMGGEVEVRARP